MMRKNILLILALSFCFLLQSCAGKSVDQAGPYAQGEIFTVTGDSLSMDEFSSLLSKSTYILLVENHSSAHHNEVQSKIVEAMVHAGVKPVIGLEMVTKEKQAILDSFSAGKLSLGQVATRLAWRDSWSFPFDLYKPLFQTAAKYRLPMVALNAPQSTARAVSSNRAVPSSEFKWLPKRLGGVKSQGKAMTFDKSILDRQAVSVNKVSNNKEVNKALAEYNRLRTLYEASIADTAVSTREKYKAPIVIVIGQENLKNGDYGTVKFLRKFDPSANISIVLPTESLDKAHFIKTDRVHKDTKLAESLANEIYFFCSRFGMGSN